MKSFIGTVEKVISRNGLNEGIFRTETGEFIRFQARDVFVTKNRIRIFGEFSPQRYFCICRYDITGTLESWLPEIFAAKHRKDIGKIDSLLGEWGAAEILEHPERLDEWLPAKRLVADEIRSYLFETHGLPNLLNFFYRFKLSDRKIIEIYRLLGPQAVYTVDSNPYSLARLNSIPFHVAETLARERKIPPQSSERIQGGIQYVYSHYLNSGNSYIGSGEMENRVFRLFGQTISKERIREEIFRFLAKQGDKVIRSKEGLLFDRHLFFAEIQIARRLKDLSSCCINRTIDMQETIDSLIESGRLPVLDDEQRKGIQMVYDHPVMIVQGEAGTGKTSWISFLLTVFKSTEAHAVVKLAALTGKAARRITEVTGFPAQTIHSLLGKGIGKHDRILYHYHKNPLKADLLIIDESSMINEYLWRDLLWAVSRGTRIVFVGDPNQLEPIGPGRPFLDMLEFGIPAIKLKCSYRNQNHVLKLARAILSGQVSPELLEGEGITILPLDSVDRIKEELVNQYVKHSGDYPIVSMYREEFSLGVDSLNPYLKRRINPSSSHLSMSENDPVIQTMNTSKADNGEIGTVIEIMKSQGVIINFGADKQVVYTSDERMQQLDLAYAITTAKTQGSQYEGVIIPLLDIKRELLHRHSMWYRNSLYTAVTRAQKKLIIIGDIEELIRGAARPGTARRSRLLHRLKRYWGEKPFASE